MKGFQIRRFYKSTTGETVSSKVLRRLQYSRLGPSYTTARNRGLKLLSFLRSCLRTASPNTCSLSKHPHGIVAFAFPGNIHLRLHYHPQSRPIRSASLHEVQSALGLEAPIFGLVSAQRPQYMQGRSMPIDGWVSQHGFQASYGLLCHLFFIPRLIHSGL
jgi:hypothetical protein